jgi:hypothetical protein
MIIRTILSTALLGALATTSLQAQASSKKHSSSKKETATPKVVPATPLASGWSYNNGVWTHVDGYKLVNGKVVRAGIQTHKKAPPPPTKAEMDVAMKKKPAVRAPADAAVDKAAQRERNLAPRPASQTGTHL